MSIPRKPQGPRLRRNMYSKFHCSAKSCYSCFDTLEHIFLFSFFASCAKIIDIFLDMRDTRQHILELDNI
jgi:hypothetical protein